MVANGQDYNLLRDLDLSTDDVALKTPDMLQVARQQAKKKISESHAANARGYNFAHWRHGIRSQFRPE